MILNFNSAHAMTAALCIAGAILAALLPGPAAAGEIPATDPRPLGFEILTWHPPAGLPKPEFEAYRDSAGQVVRLSHEGAIPFTPYGQPLTREFTHYHAYRRAARQFPDVRACLADSESNQVQPDLTRFDWRKFWRGVQVQVCLYRIATSYQTAEDFEKWLANQGFETSSGYALRYRPDRDYKLGLDYTVSGRWRVREKGALIYWSGFMRNFWEANAHSFGVWVRFRVEIGIVEVGASYAIK